MNLRLLDRHGHANRLAILFALWFVTLTALDLAITWTGVHHFAERMEELGIAEGNPYTDFSSVGAFVIPEVVAFAVGIAMVFGGGVLKMRRLVTSGQCEADLTGLGLRAFQKAYDRLGVVATFLILIPVAVAVGRVVPVVNNLMWLLAGWGPTALLPWPFGAMVACMLAMYPSYYMIRKFTLDKEPRGA